MSDIDLPEIVLEPGERERPTLKTIARLLGLAVPTVSRALSDAPDIGAKTKKRVRALANELGYRPNRAGLRLRTGKTNVIALILCTDHDVMNHTAKLINAVASALRGTSYHLIVTPYFPDESPLDPVKYVVQTGSADGVILNRIQPDDPRVAYLKQQNFPFALHGRTNTCSDAPYLDFDNAVFGKHCVDAFHRRGRKNVLIVAPPLDQNYAQHLVAGATSTASELGLDTAILPDATSDSSADLVTGALTRYLRAHPKTDAVICASAPVALAATLAIEKLDRTIGADIDVAAKEAIPLLKAFRKDILVCYEDVGETGLYLAEALIRAIDAPHLPPMQKLIAPEPL
ncbi:MAG: LacI family DNA-binding transcriptional regulator [Silicimonas sp.]|nr:LacI family DNA-binding transcriptional regulator [Silicimonas sp.]